MSSPPLQPPSDPWDGEPGDEPTHAVNPALAPTECDATQPEPTQDTRLNAAVDGFSFDGTVPDGSTRGDSEAPSVTRPTRTDPDSTTSWHDEPTCKTRRESFHVPGFEVLGRIGRGGMGVRTRPGN